MSARYRGPHRCAMLGVAMALTALGLLAGPAPASAECPYFPIPPATEAARSAREVIVGTVIENVGGDIFDFRVRIDHVLRGPASVGDVRRFEALYPGWPLTETSDGTLIAPCEPIPGSTGNVIAFALDALAPDGTTRYSAASWIAGDLTINRDVPRTTLAEMQRLAALPATDTTDAVATVAAMDRPTIDPVVVLLAVFLSALGVGLFGPRRRSLVEGGTER